MNENELEQIKNITLIYYVDQGRNSMYCTSILEAAQAALKMVVEDTGLPVSIENERHVTVWSTFFGGAYSKVALEALIEEHTVREPKLDEFKIQKLIQEHHLTFHSPRNKKVGKLFWSEEGLRFEGNADESALTFLSSIERLFPTKVEQIKQQAVEEYLIQQKSKEEVLTNTQSSEQENEQL